MIIPTGGAIFDGNKAKYGSRAIIRPSSSCRVRLVPGIREKFAGIV